ncbi:bifunctional (p)ppGpp synthetase/guanosine-3',5'-bis(diphosphate) 3'-pyrophosphohydrolase [Luteibacter sp. PPL201]|uniref:GTP pyrophosphokinase n=1 Tax=Luteibacter sahnii TaxID=3021977 RepID=A0ABT6BBB5_9GAMM|nr:bifunctional (p)ppGpp synthetase/guanosine-3',5'-bis(diphosphate) 3'-pyrophosphohydrolase [Luteibacter sp. PPL193]MDY1547159.1 bifunctional (p)ppGpp synthetase/guanosine-3',5'-bis(diphosphate) 3'-pyrophosphohydrolase [Luteibacter sp. PPL193]
MKTGREDASVEPRPLPMPLTAQAREACAALPAVARAEGETIIELLRLLGCDDETCASALWFLVSRALPGAVDTVAAHWPASLRRLVEGQGEAEKVWALHAQRGKAGGNEGLRRLLLAIIRDLRVVFVLLARQLAAMRTAMALPDHERRELAQLTSDIHAPLANRLGIWQLKWELEDLAFRYLEPDTYRRIARLLDERRADRERFIATSLDQLRRVLDDAGIRADLAGRPKHIFSIWKKMKKKGLEFSDLYDIRAVRILVDSVADCYAALGLVHSLWPHLPGEFDDYVARPKGNGYRSLHTAVLGPEGKTLEVQIRTHEMHRANELGVAAHWRYKEGGGADAEFEAKIAWMRKLLEPRAEGDDEADLAAGFATELMEDRVYVLSPKGEVIDMPRGATVLDFAYHIHTEVGHRCRGAKLNGRIVPLTTAPRSGDRVEILTAKASEPSRDWLSSHHGYLHTSRAKEKVRAWFRREAHDANVAAGKLALEKELRRLALDDVDLPRLAAAFRLKTVDDLYTTVALGEVTLGQVARALQEPVTPEITQSATPVASRGAQHDRGALSIEGVGNLLTTLARCCQPLPGDPVRGFITRGRGVSVHRADCASLARLARKDPDRVIEVSWGRVEVQNYEVDVELRGYDRKGLQKDVATTISNVGPHIVASSSRVHVRTGEVEMRFTLRVRDYEQLSTLLGRLAALPNVTDARRVGGR